MRGGEEDDAAAEGGELMKAEGPDGEGGCHLVLHDDDGDGDDEDVEDCDVGPDGEGGCHLVQDDGDDGDDEDVEEEEDVRDESVDC